MLLNQGQPRLDLGFPMPAPSSDQASSKVFNLSDAPRDLQDFAESQFLRADPSINGVATVEVWMTAKTATIEPPDADESDMRVTAWEHVLHRWLSRMGAAAGDVVHLVWLSPPLA